MKYLSKCLSSILICVITLSQITGCSKEPNSIPKGWSRVYIKDVGYYDLPPTLEIQKGKYKSYIDKKTKLLGYDSSGDLVAQTKGLNDSKITNNYARVQLETTIAEEGKYEKLDFDITENSQEFIQEFESNFKSTVQKKFKQLNINIKKWYPSKMEVVNGMSCIHASYIRQFKNAPIVVVHLYLFQNNDRLHMLTLSYRLSEIEYWKTDFDKILSSFKITNYR